ncbi:uncharacterized protein LOC126926416 [Bombus affinis]|uniref:uncharacterized protein LOC126926416 n=1 Tax=Bombus affinis TaxID=309941 RepID=UPI0021B73A0D|nr:uncharacterized protein LOC126926416 [Bombus affinis]
MDSPDEGLPNVANCDTNSMSQMNLTVEQSVAIIREVIKSFMQNSNAKPQNVCLPRFNPEVEGTDPAVWCAAANQIVEDNSLEGSALYSILTDNLKGSAAPWFRKVLVDEPAITWPRFKEIFAMRFGGNETGTWALTKMMMEQPLEDESLSAFGLRLRNFLKMRWGHLTIDEIINACVLARLVLEDEHIKEIAFAKNVKTEEELMNEIRDMPSVSSESSRTERHKSSRSRIRCFYCGMTGHKMAVCRKKIKLTRQKNKQKSEEYRPNVSSSYFTCLVEGHNETNCPWFKRTS